MWNADQNWLKITVHPKNAAHTSHYDADESTKTFDIITTNIAITVTLISARCRLKSPQSRLFSQPFVLAQIKENIKAPRQRPLWGESTGEQWIPLIKDQ